MKKLHFDVSATIQMPSSMKAYMQSLAVSKNVSLNVVMNGLLEYAIAESTQTELDAYIQRTQDLKDGKLDMEDENEHC